MARSMLKATGLPGTFWGVIVSTVIFILNRAPAQSFDGKTAYEAWHGMWPVVHFLLTFGRIAHIKNMKPHLKKLDDAAPR